MSLYGLGFRKGTIYEIIVTTFDSRKHPHAAPMGVTVSKAKELILRAYVETETLSTLKESRCGVINVTSNPCRFYRTALKREPWVEPPPRIWFERAKRVTAPRLRSSDSYLEFYVMRISGHGPCRAIRCKVVHEEFTKRRVAPYCRSTSATIESIIHATRVKQLLKMGDTWGAKRLIDLMKDHRELIDRVSPKSEEAKIIHCLLTHMEGLAGPRK